MSAGIRAGYKRTEVGVIPEQWAVSTVGHQFEVKLGKMLDAERNVGTPKQYLGNRAVQWDRIDIGDLPTVPMSRPDIEKYRLKQGDLLVCEGGEVGRCAVWESPLEECYYQKALHRLRPLRGFDPRLMAAYLRSWSEGGLLQSHVTQTSIAHLPREKFMEVPLPVPPAKEQHAIAAALSDVDALLAGLDRLIAKKRDLKQAAMQQLLTGQTRLPGFQGEWEVKRLGDIFQIAAGTSKSAFIVENGDYWVCDMGSVSTTGKLIVSKRTNYRGDYLAAGDLIMPKDDIGGGNIIGRVGYIDADHTYVLGDHVYHLRAEVGNPLFLSYAINSHRTNSQLRRKVIGSAQLGLGRKSVTEQEIQFPPVEEQTAIASALSDMDAELTALEARRDKTRALKQAMMQELLTGKTRLV
jgi:type I restriction enzyme S subunit